MPDSLMRSAADSPRSRDLVRFAGVLFAMYLGAQLLWFANALVLAGFLGVLFGLAVAAGADRMERYRIPRGVSAVSIVLAFFVLLFGVGASMAPTIREQSTELRARVPEAADRIEQWLNKRGVVFTTAASDSSSQVTASQTLRSTLARQMGRVAQYVFPFISQTLAVAGGILLIIFMAVYIGAEPDVYRRGALYLFPLRSRDRAAQVLTAIATVLRKWLVTQLIAMVVIGVVTTVALLILRVKAAFALGLLAGLLEFVPTIGPILSAVPAIAMGFLDSPQKALTVTVVYVGIQFLENNLLIPLLMKDGVNVPPVLTIISQALLTLLFGFLGLMVAVPLMAAIIVAVRMLYVEHDPPSASPTPPNPPIPPNPIPATGV